jgi:hypothetical protein
MDRSEATAAIESALAARKKTVLNKNAISALFGAFGDPAGALGKIFLGRNDAVDTEKQKITQDLVLDLLCRIDEAMTATNRAETAANVSIAGTIEAFSNGAQRTIGVDVQGSQPTTFAPGTIVRAGGTTGSVIGVRIGGGNKS